MAKATTMPNGKKYQRLTTRQQLDSREMSMRFARKLMTQLAGHALGWLDDPETGEPIQPMSNSQLRAAEIVLKKILPDQSAVQLPPADNFDSMGREEMIDLLAGAVSSNPQLLENEEIREAINNSQTVVSITGKS